ncbi:hypothetical protein BX666DRAFT_1993378 [Dichotomocladium elegans]|nr:hypothetical protein BX666DRAFT_1993378 [Dichotomocladium elegans]
MTGKGVVRSIKNYAKAFSETQRKVREATSNDPWGPSGTLMNEIAQLTYDQHHFIEIMDMIDKRLNDKGKNWRHVFKALLLLDYCLHVGSDNVVLYAKENIYVIKTLKEFQHIDSNGRDVGANVRQKAKDITSLLTDEARLKDERRQRQQMRERMAGVNDYMNDAMGISATMPGELSSRSGQGLRGDNEDRELQRALAESKRMAEDEERKRRVRKEDDELAEAIRLSEQEAKEKEQKQKEKLERENKEKLFGAGQNLSLNPFPQIQSFDSSFNPYQQQQWPQNTGLTNLTFGDPVTGQLAFQPTGNPYQQPQQHQQQQHNNPYQQFSGGFGQSLQAQMTGMPQQSQFTGLAPFQTGAVTGFQPPQMTGFQAQPLGGFQQSQNQNMLAASNSPVTSFQQPQMSAASNNPFGQHQQPQATGVFGQSIASSPTFASSSVSTHSPSLANASISAAGQSRSFTFPSSPAVQPATSTVSSNVTSGNDPHHAKLNLLLANRDDGMDTFGNTGNLRIPVGTGFANSLNAQITGQPTNMRSNSTPDLLGTSGTENNNGVITHSTSFADASIGTRAKRSDVY